MEAKDHTVLFICTGNPARSVIAVMDQLGNRRFKAYSTGMLIYLRRRIQRLLALPMASLDRMAIQREVKVIGTAGP